MNKKRDKKMDFSMEIFPNNKGELTRKLRKLETREERIAYISHLNKLAESLIRDHTYGAAMKWYENSGALQKARETAEKGERYFTKHDPRNQPGGATYCHDKVEYYDGLIAEKLTTGRKFPKLPPLEEMLSIIGVSGAFLCSLIFLSSNMTGNTILNFSIKTSNVLGALLFLVGIVASFLYAKKRRSKI